MYRDGQLPTHYLVACGDRTNRPNRLFPPLSLYTELDHQGGRGFQPSSPVGLVTYTDVLDKKLRRKGFGRKDGVPLPDNFMKCIVRRRERYDTALVAAKVQATQEKANVEGDAASGEDEPMVTWIFGDMMSRPAKFHIWPRMQIFFDFSIWSSSNNRYFSIHYSS